MPSVDWPALFPALRDLAVLSSGRRIAGRSLLSRSSALSQIVEAGVRESERSRTRYRQALERSGRCLGGLGEPHADLDFTEHRWVAGHREEAYSDWLAWIIANLNAESVLRVFGVADQPIAKHAAGRKVTVARESLVANGHDGSRGRLDLKIDFEDQAILVVEVKLTDAEVADTVKNEGYRRSVEAAHAPSAYVIVVSAAEDEDYSGFRPRLWSDVCIELRLAALQLFRDKEQVLLPGMLLSFAAAVEQNLLELSPRRNPIGLGALALAELADHLDHFVRRAEENESHQQGIRR